MQEMKAHIFSSFFILSNRLQVAGDGMDPRMTLKQWLLIAVLMKSEEEGLTISDLAKRMGSSRQNAMKMARLLERQGFLTISKREEDKRYSELRVTSKCLAHCKGREEKEEKFIEMLFSGFSDEELRMLAQSFFKLAENITGLEETYA